jgi:uncharacterized repeat protein (TIGR01451 family)
MTTNPRRWLYGFIGLALGATFLFGTQAWASPLTQPSAQTLPGVTPTRPFVVTEEPIQPTDAPTQPAPEATPQPGQTALPPATGTPSTPSSLVLSKKADPSQAWPGAKVTFTITLVNTGKESLRNVQIEDTLPPQLIPGEVLTPLGAWAGRTLRATIAVLPPGGRVSVVFTATVAEDAAVAAIINRVFASSAEGYRLSASSVVALPPTLLPVTGAAWARDWR